MLWLLCIFVTLLVSSGFGQVGAELKHTLHSYTGERILAENNNSSGTAVTLRTQRVDPLDGLKKYRGGYNITNKHYWSSTIFTGKFGYIVAGIWMISGLIYGTILLVSNLCCFNKRRTRRGRALSIKNKRRVDNDHSLWPIVFSLLMTLLAIVASGVALGGTTRFNSRAKAIKSIILGAANEASETINNVTAAVQSIKNNTQVYANLDQYSSINSTIGKLSDDANNIRRKADKSMRRLNKGLRIMNVLTIVTVSVNLVAILALLASGPLRLRRIFSMLIVLSFILTCLFWLYFGLYYFLNKFAGDTCAALDEYKLDPKNSTLSSILPCNDRVSARRALHDVGAGIHGIVDQVNSNISTLESLALPGLKYICNPFSGPPDYSYLQENCTSDTILIRNIPQILKVYTCLNGTCKGGEFISAHDYDRTITAITSIQMILDAYPGMERLVDCQLVKDAFSLILCTECKSLKKYVNMSWAAFATLSTIMTILLLICIVKSHHYSKYHPNDGVIKPHSMPDEKFEVGTTEMGSTQPEHNKLIVG